MFEVFSPEVREKDVRLLTEVIIHYIQVTRVGLKLVTKLSTLAGNGIRGTGEWTKGQH